MPTTSASPLVSVRDTIPKRGILAHELSRQPDRRHEKPLRGRFLRATGVGGIVLLASALIAVAAVAQEDREPPPADRVERPETRQLYNGKDLKGWRVIADFDFKKHGEIRHEKEVLILEKGNPATGISWKGEFPRTDYEVSLEAKRIEGRDFFCGMTFPVGQEYCTLIVGGWGGNVTGLSNVDGQNADENETTGYGEFKTDQWYHIRLRVTDRKIEAWVDKRQIVDLETADRKFSIWWEQEPARPFGIATWYTTAGLRNIELRRLGEKKEE